MILDSATASANTITASVINDPNEMSADSAAAMHHTLVIVIHSSASPLVFIEILFGESTKTK